MSSSLPPPHPRDADSDEDDEDYVPPADDVESTNEDSDGREHKKAKVDIEPTADPTLGAAEREQAWNAFQNVEVARPKVEQQTMITVAKRFRFAGEEVVQKVTVPADSDDAAKWPLWEPELTQKQASPSATSYKQPSASPAPRPGPRKPKTVLRAPGPKPAKLSTLAKSALDWQAHAGDDADLDAARRSGAGLLDRTAFLDRVDERREVERARALANTKRKRPGGF